jgi:hypothetical protein
MWGWRGALAETPEDALARARLDDGGDDAHTAVATRAVERIDEEHARP